MPHDLAGLPGDADVSSGIACRIHEDLIGCSPVMADLYERIEKAARSHATVFITGETGTGKELCAEAVHGLSRRAGKPFIPINCAAIPRDLMESELFGHIKGAFTGAIAERDGAARLADGGTLFLDEVAEMTPDMQSKLLRFLQSRTFTKVGGSRVEPTDVRIICATNRDPAAEIRAGRFRADLFYRLHVLPLHMPRLREREGDVAAIARALLRTYSKEENKGFTGFSVEAENSLRRYGWPGNVRELQNIIRHIVVMHDGDTVTAQMLPGFVRDSRIAESFTPDPAANDEAMTLAQAERRLIEKAILRSHGNIQAAAARLGVSPSTLYRKKVLWGTKPAAERK